ncbi:Planctomycete cytochrome C [Polystyrenella longa]|uniref:Planctomycete cytochrome C n=1 Tax=Polystyrenella longa TaxID=2528007 RepID=A0A518CS76_9PLAN|nr:PSD1 and planctomycete cytochrome C domain-containing protein [Polystyrenella longa]QDU82063.1 Planctomycete cytochrome C [Polystyrenella longa]
MKTFPSLLFGLALAFLPGVATAVRAESAETPELTPEFSQEQIAFFETSVRPLLKSECYQCHSARKQEGSLRLDARSLILEGGESGAAVEPGDPDSSLLIGAVRRESFEMPPKKKLPEDQVAILTKWVEMGAPWPAGEEIEPIIDERAELSEAGHQHWAFQPVQPVEVPEVQNLDWIRNPVDAFILNRLEQHEMTPSAPADRAQLIRRVYYDLTGLPPETDEVQQFINDDRPEAYAELVDRLLASPHYGEKWGRHWLDLVRYAETNSYERDDPKPFVWKYRDYVISSFNEDKPYDQFILEQLAGDELDPDNPEAIIATGYYRLGIWDDEPADRVLAYFDDMDDVVSTTSEVFMGLTFGCARCHDHKLDPILQADYYRLLAFMRNVKRYGVRADDTVHANSVTDIGSPEEKAHYAKAMAEYKVRVNELQTQITVLVKPVVDQLQGVDKEEWQYENRRIDILNKFAPKLISQSNVDKYVSLSEHLTALRNSPPPGLEKALSVKEEGPDPLLTFLMQRGNAHSPGEQIEPVRPSALVPFTPELEPIEPREHSTGRRAVLAKWLASAEHPLTVRVLVNRVWQFHFGRGIVRSTSNFGLAGEEPTHPQLLDWLAQDFVDHGWSLKHLHRRMLLSSTYQMASASRQDHADRDPQNDLFWRFNMRRLEAEEVRDSILAASGNLTSNKLYGPSIYSYIPDEVKAGQSRPGHGWGTSSPNERYRRSIYIHAKRSLVTPILSSFDVADLDDSCPVRFVTTQPTQALGMLNSDFLTEQAEDFARSLVESGKDSSDTDLVQKALKRVLQREPTEIEIERGVNFIIKMQQDRGMNYERAVQSFCLLVLNLNEFVYLD